ncbi:hypothetical protein AALO_G00156930 [Alosa alosa]|uniref:Uncharacterized protein n=1 Tax=Alosa alosa TaxID=278164 RepID=A0AAV6GFG0_9TELE|nr:hypothetical protein AALO_G00156930 [Alosa alosa]
MLRSFLTEQKYSKYVFGALTVSGCSNAAVIIKRPSPCTHGLRFYARGHMSCGSRDASHLLLSENCSDVIQVLLNNGS